MFETPRKGFEKNLIGTRKLTKLHKNGRNQGSYVQYSKKQRKEWWASLSEEEKSRRVNKWEHDRDTSQKPAKKLPPLNDDQKQQIVNRMIHLGLEADIIPAWRHLASNSHQEAIGRFYRNNF